ncbi:sugar fermentation stimulation protein [Tamilnaduibacter salinus]|uniref:Sugar fermentation stimulation protein homolog n=1 Tax=Tamilnaduibacter salinus TaxID=1484056 RepID=A0A2A2I675_9GAMM|nr:DNA/RNA nuclease SfsA [Tamilnaduibacter salinus]PAV27511.1 DNA/RNA nuclease SfsA [Tamilnaduibacter salinus]PVY77042.1 sugar fermentation stimulation protein [Tamilnaduibacter salinus]
MDFSPPLIEGVLVRRYKRFLADIRLTDGAEVVAHCPNTGSMLGCCVPGSRVWLSESSDPKRKLRYTWELVETSPGEIACINTARPNRQVRELLESGGVPELAGYPTIRSEVRYGQEKSRIDLHLSGHARRADAWVEVKNVTLAESGQGYFPDAVTTRGQKHLRELMEQVRLGDRAVLLFCVNHTGIRSVVPADHIDPAYGRLLREALAAGVEVMAWQADITGQAITLTHPVDVYFPML